MGSGCFFERGVSFLYCWRTRFGRNCIIDALAQFKCPTTVNTDIRYNIDIADNVFIGRGTIIDSNLSVKIGRDAFIAPYCFITDTHHKFRDSETTIRMQGYDYKAVAIGEDVWIGAHVVVIAGVSIGRGSIIGANSTVTHDIPPNIVACGTPARVTSTRGQD
jgi:acetyltransferase-like isoleucine patch superfamily enzyme